MLWCCRHPSIDMTRHTGEMGQDFKITKTISKPTKTEEINNLNIISNINCFKYGPILFSGHFE
jgi:hypothetical protein